MRRFIIGIIFVITFTLVASYAHAQDNIPLPDSGFRDILSLKPGWNLVSSPLTGTQAFASHQTTCTYTSPLWAFDSGTQQYEQATQLAGKKGMWIRVAGDCTTNVTGDSLYTLNSFFPIALGSGWNFIAGPPSAVPVAELTGCTITRGPFWYNPSTGWEQSTALEPGKGYALRIASSCSMSYGNISERNDARFVRQDVPATMIAGHNYSVTVVMRNAGTTTWAENRHYRLGSQNPQDNNIWSIGRVYFAPGENINPGQEKQFTFNVTTPQQPGNYNFRWRMLRELVEWFGDYSPTVQVKVITSNITDQSVCTVAQVQCGETCCDASTLSDGSKVRLFGVTDQEDGTFFGPNDITIMPDGRIIVSDWVNQQVQVFSPTFQFLTRFGKPGGAEQENNDMLSVAVSHDGRIFSADAFSAVKEFGSEYQFIRRHNFASGAANDSNFYRFNFPHLTFDRTTQDNYIYIADQNNNRVLRLTRMSDGSLGEMRIFRGVNNEIKQPEDVAIITVAGQKRMYVSNGDNTVRVYKDPFGTPQTLATLNGMFTHVGSVAVSPAKDRLYISDHLGNRIHIFTLETLTYLMPLGSKGTGDGQFDSPQGIAVDASGNFYIADSGNNRIQKFTSEGTFLAKFGSRNPLANGKFHRAGSTAYDPVAHEVYVGDIYNCRIQVFDEQGNFRRAFGKCAQPFNLVGGYNGPDLSYIGDFDIDPATGRVYIADSFNQRIAIYKMDGTFLFSFGSAGRGPGQFDNPIMLEVSNDKLYVGDWGDFLDGQLDGRVQTFSLSGEYLSMLAPNGNTEGKVNQPVGIFDDPRNGRIFVSDAHRYTNIYGSDGQYLQRFRIVNEQTGIPVHGDGFIEQDGDMWLTTGSDRIERWNADTFMRLQTYGGHGDALGQFRYPSKPSLGRNGELYIGDWNDRVTVYYPA